VADNQLVHAGDLLIQLDDRDYRAALARAEAAVAMQQAVLPNLEATRQVQESVIAQAHAAIRSITAEIQRTRDDADRAQKLLAASAVSEQVYQQADTDYVRAQADGEKARAALAVAERQLGVIATQKVQAEAALQQALAQRETARLYLGYTQLRDPIDGIVGNRNAQVGAYVAAGSPLISLVPLHGLWIDANSKETQIAAMHPGSPAEVSIDSLPGRVFRGRVASLAPATGAKFSVLPPENATGNFTRIVQRLAVRIILDDEGAAALRPGLSVQAEVDTQPHHAAGS
jgi:membrane fusion protein (multidrug efflux system)